MGFYTASHQRILYGINSIDIMGCSTPEASSTPTIATIIWKSSCSAMDLLSYVHGSTTGSIGCSNNTIATVAEAEIASP